MVTGSGIRSIPMVGVQVTLKKKLPPEQRFLRLIWLLAFTKSFAWLVCRVIGLFTPPSRQTSHANDSVNAKSHGRKKPLLTRFKKKRFEKTVLTPYNLYPYKIIMKLQGTLKSLCGPLTSSPSWVLFVFRACESWSVNSWLIRRLLQGKHVSEQGLAVLF